MTQVEQQEFDELNSEQQEDYNHYKGKYPNWDHSKIIVRVGFTAMIDDYMLGENPDLDTIDEDTMKCIMERLEFWLKEKFPRIWDEDEVKELFSNIVHNIIN